MNSFRVYLLPWLFFRTIFHVRMIGESRPKPENGTREFEGGSSPNSRCWRSDCADDADFQRYQHWWCAQTRGKKDHVPYDGQGTIDVHR
jgi:hypothetical protein